MENGSLQEDSHAKIYRSQETEQDSTDRGLVFGLNIGDLLGTYDLNTQLWKMSELCLFEDLTECWDRLPKSGMMQNGKIYEQATWAHRTGENEYGLWRTPDANMERGESKLRKYEIKDQSRNAVKLERSTECNREGIITDSEEVNDREYKRISLRRQIQKSGNGDIKDDVSDSERIGCEGQGERKHSSNKTENRKGETGDAFNVRFGSQWSIEPDVGRVANGIPSRVDRLKGIGNSIVPQIAEILFRQIKPFI